MATLSLSVGSKNRMILMPIVLMPILRVMITEYRPRERKRAESLNLHAIKKNNRSRWGEIGEWGIIFPKQACVLGRFGPRDSFISSAPAATVYLVAPPKPNKPSNWFSQNHFNSLTLHC